MAKESTAQRKTVGRVMHEFKHGELKRGRGGKVKSRRQAIAIALSEAGASKYQSRSENRRRLARTKTKERRGQTAQQEKEGRMGASRDLRGRSSRRSPSRTGSGKRSQGVTRAELYQRARRKGIPGASRMKKAQ